MPFPDSCPQLTAVEGHPPHIAFSFCDAIMYHMLKASVRDLRYKFHEVEDLLRQGQEIQITKRKRVIARLIPERREKKPEIPDFLSRLKRIYGKPLKVTGAELIAKDREDRF
jgi:antitoxin (DNA-binding transcriptional repressor) of toxin-antitoxin stability system